MFDTHAHLTDSPYFETIEKVVADCQTAGLTGVIIASSNITDSKRAIDLASKFPNYLYASVGIHPQQTDPENSSSISNQLSSLDLLITHNQKLITSIGECGLDFTPAPPGEKDRLRKDQYALFQGQINLAQKYNLPLIIHARQAYDEVLEIISSYSLKPKTYNLKGVFHCYAGGRKRIPKILALPGEWYFGFDGNLTYDEGLQSIVKQIPPNRILIETDTPFLAPMPFRGQTCYPKYVTYVQKQINELFGRDLTSQIQKNTQQLFCVTI